MIPAPIDPAELFYSSHIPTSPKTASSATKLNPMNFTNRNLSDILISRFRQKISTNFSPFIDKNVFPTSSGNIFPRAEGEGQAPGTKEESSTLEGVSPASFLESIGSFCRDGDINILHFQSLLDSIKLHYGNSLSVYHLSLNYLQEFLMVTARYRFLY